MIFKKQVYYYLLQGFIKTKNVNKSILSSIYTDIKE